MKALRSLSVVCCHAEGEIGDVIVGGVLDIAARTMHEKLTKFEEAHDDLRLLLHNEPRGRLEMSTNIITAPCDPRADAGFLIMAPGNWVPMSGSNAICTVTVLLETGMLPMIEPVTTLQLDTAAGLITATAECENGSCKSVAFDNIPAFAFALGLEVDLPRVGKVLVDIAYGGQWYAVVDASSLDITPEVNNGHRLIALGEALKKAVLDTCVPEHPENPLVRGIHNVIIRDPLTVSGTERSVRHVNIVHPGRLDRSPCGTGSSACLAIMHAKGQIEVGQSVKFISMISSMFVGQVKETRKVGSFDAIIPNIKGRAWITGTKQILLDPDDPYPTGFRL